MKNDYHRACSDLIALINRAKAAAVEIADEQGMTYMQLFVLYFIHLHGQVAMGRLANSLHCDASNVTGLIDRLVVQQLVRREESPHDRRTKTLSLTSKGQQMVDAVMALLPARLGCDKLTKDEKQALHVIVQKIAA